jgi:hypothetical protein
MNETVRTDVDTRHLKSGQVRLRFRLTEKAKDIVSIALSTTPYGHSGAALDAIAMSYLAGGPASHPLGIPAAGSKRLLVRLFPDQYECVRCALDILRRWAATDAEALVTMCLAFLAEYQDDTCGHRLET